MLRGRVTDIFFDLDHTLWDFEKNSALTFEKILATQDVKIDLSAFLQVYVPINQEYWKLYREEKVTKTELRYQRLKNTFDALKVTVSDETINKLADAYIAHLSSFNHIFPNTKEILEYLRPNYRLHIITNGFQEIQHKKLRSAEIAHYFDQVINSESAGVKKPHPHIFNFALQQANVTATKSVMIGDNLEADIMGAMALGMHALHFNSLSQPEHEICTIINDLGEIKSIL